ncbi:capsular polysaccharide biosynthesis protein [hydrothermal vent metagenome]|uniref:Capsular polysaccharide biosynthesis protein n=1 Tax=hydrothermal vent metagenome TaxID=652676 RepID=A0A3B0S132_9ZZZZ
MTKKTSSSSGKVWRWLYGHPFLHKIAARVFLSLSSFYYKNTKLDPVDPVTQALSNQPNNKPAWIKFCKKGLYPAVNEAMETERFKAGIIALLPFIHYWPEEQRLQILAARFFQKLYSPDQATPVWQKILQRFPNSREAFLLVNRAMIRDHGPKQARKNLDQKLPVHSQQIDTQITRAQCLEDLHDPDAADMAWDLALQLDENDPRLLFMMGSSLEKRGYLFDAYEVFKRAQRLQPNRLILGQRLQHLGRILHLKSDDEQQGERLYAQGHVIQQLVKDVIQNRKNQQKLTKIPGKIILINSSLGPGGAERQFVNTAIGLQKQIQTGELPGPLEVWCRSLIARRSGDFFLEELRQAGVIVRQYGDFVGAMNAKNSRTLAAYSELVDFLPRQILEPTLKITDALRQANPGIVHIWQDGSIAAAALGALIADIPIIALGYRSQPPPDKGKDRPYFRPLMRALIDAPGVVISTNSQAGRKRYSQWLDILPNRFHVILNGTVLPDHQPASQTTSIARSFLKQKEQAAMGVIMRFDENKRPALWLETAKLVLQKRPEAKFLMIGSGPLLEQTKTQAKAYNMQNKILFLEQTSDVRFWLQQMQCFVLLSAVEGVPNAVIEAQLTGIPVIASPAGGSAEAFLPEKSGILLADQHAGSPEAIANAINALLADEDRIKEMGIIAQKFAQEKFSTATMIEKTIAFYQSEVSPIKAE